MKAIDYLEKMYSLNERIKNNTATQVEKDEYILLLYQGGHITEKRYKDYVSGRNSQDLLKTGLAIGEILMVGYLVDKALNK